MSIRPVTRIVHTKSTLEGAGVRLQRAFGFGDTAEFDPFLLFDDFRNDNPRRLSGGLPVASAPRHRDHHLCSRRHRRARRQPRQSRQPRRRRRAMDDGRQRHPPSGNAARAIRTGRMHGFQLWANLPSSLKMTAPRYQDVAGGRHSRSGRRRWHARARRLRRILGQARAGGGRRGRPALSRRLGSAGQAKDAAGRDAQPRVCVRLRRIGHVPRRVRAAAAC